MQGGEPYTPVDREASLAARSVVLRHDDAFANQLDAGMVVHLTMSYQINKPGRSSEIALKLLNVTGYPDFFGFRYNYLSQTIDVHRESTLILNLSWKKEF